MAMQEATNDALAEDIHTNNLPLLKADKVRANLSL